VWGQVQRLQPFLLTDHELNKLQKHHKPFLENPGKSCNLEIPTGFTCPQ
jgi:hypothetical protein